MLRHLARVSANLLELRSLWPEGEGALRRALWTRARTMATAAATNTATAPVQLSPSGAGDRGNTQRSIPLFVRVPFTRLRADRSDREAGEPLREA